MNDTPSLNINKGFYLTDKTNDKYDMYFIEVPSLLGMHFSDGQSFGRKFYLVKDWRPLFIYTGFAGFLLLELEHAEGDRATWIMDRELRFLSDEFTNLSQGHLKKLCVAAMRLINRQDGDGYLLDYIKINRGFRERLEEVAADISETMPFTACIVKRQVALCFSGHPRAFLRYAAQWKEFFEDIREEFDLQIYYHMWSSTGLLEIADGHFREGSYEDDAFTSIDQINGIILPVSYCVETETIDFNDMLESFSPVYLNQSQSSKKHILSQVYSIEKADRLRQSYERRHSPSVAVMRMRFDLVPADDMQAHKVIEEIRYIVDHPDEAIIFGTSPAYHRHHGGGGGCTYCDTAYRTRNTSKYFCVPEHQHSNDLCDLYAIGNPRSMAVYCSLFTHAETIWAEACLNSKSTEALGITPYPDQDNPQDTRVFLTGEQLEHDLHCFYPEKLLRFHLKGIAVVNSMAEFQIRRR